MHTSWKVLLCGRSHEAMIKSQLSLGNKELSVLLLNLLPHRPERKYSSCTTAVSYLRQSASFVC